MSRSDRFDWRGWLALAWALWFGVRYARMVLDARAPGLVAMFDRSARELLMF